MLDNPQGYIQKLMSFCSEVKNELAAIRPPECCKRPLIYGFMLFGRSFSFKKISMQTGNSAMAQLYAGLIKSIFGVTAEITCGGSVRPTYIARVASEADRLKILACYDYGIADKLINNDIITRECCFQSFIRGAFLSCGNINDPQKEYRAEFSVRSEKLADEFSVLLSGYGISLKKAKRQNVTVLYTKESACIEDLLTLMGVPHRTLDIMDTKILKSVKNNINRRSNCDNANISKTVEASIKQRRAIDYLKQHGILESLPAELISAADLRQNNPDSTLAELCRLSEELLTVSGLNHRLKRLMEIYESVKK
ncbi:MAG: DNA-binding protein WhiA [Acutalibacteraceae bacterium]|nr:DNA-binding protein WhiA [Acutalibacteraceae bacterium]